MNVYYLLFLLYLLAGLLLCVAVFSWAVASGQFRDQQRARYLPLLGDKPEKHPAVKWPRSMTVTVVVVCSVLLAQIVVVLILAFS